MTANNIAPLADLRYDGPSRHTTPEPQSAPTDGPPKPDANPSRASGSARLPVTLPPARAGLPTTVAAVDEHLSLIEAARQAQLDSLPQITPGDVVAAAHRDTVARILEQVRAARQRVRDDVYGLCAGCGTLIHPERLEPRPWLITCTGCASLR